MRIKWTGPGVGLLLLTMWAPLRTSAAEMPAADRTQSPYFQIEGAPSGLEAFPLEEARVDFTITGVMANVKVTQRYRNRGTAPLHARYVFPASTRAAVHGMTFQLADRVIHAQIKRRDVAKQEFEQAKQDGKSASLLEEDRPNVFRMSVANILPGETVAVELEYSELLVPTEGRYEFVYPTVVGPRYVAASAPGAAPEAAHAGFLHSAYTPAGAAPSYRFALSGRVNTGVALQEVNSPSHHIQVVQPTPAQAEVSLDRSEASGGQRDFILRYRLEDDRVQSGLVLQQGPDAGEGFFLLLVQPPRRVVPALLPPREYVFIVDVSGSMVGFPLDTAKELMRGLTEQLRPQDRFNVLLFSGASQLLWPASQAATAENVRAATDLLGEQQGGGGTELTSALKTALSLPAADWMSRTFVVVTDGFIGQERESFAEIHDHLGAANVFCFGIGSSVNRYLVEGIAHAGLGESFVVTKPEEAKAQTERFLKYVQSPVLTRLHLEVEGADVSDVEPAQLPDLLAERPLVIHGKWHAGAPGTPHGALRVVGQSGQGPFVARVPLTDTPVLPESAGLQYLWARSRIGNLTDFSPNPSDPPVQEEVTQLGLRYHLLTPFTSFIAVSERRTQVPGTAADQTLPLPEGVSALAVGGEVRVGAEPGWVVCVALALACGLVVRHLRSRQERA